MIQQLIGLGEELRRRRLAAGLTLTGMAQLIHYSKGQLSKVERGIKTPSLELVRLCDAVLEADGSLVALLQEWPVRVTETAVQHGDEEVWVLQLSADDQSWFAPMSRRQAIAAGVASISAMTISRPTAAPVGASAETLGIFHSVFDQYRQLGQATAADLLLPALIAQTQTIQQLSRKADSRTSRALLTLGSRYAEYIGWLIQETGNEQAALWWTRRAVDLAAAGGDHDFAAYGLVRHALITLYRDDAMQTIELAQQAQGGGAPARIRGLAAQREAQGHALAGDYSACMRSLDRARPLLVQHTSESDAPVIGPTNLADPAEMVRGWCMYDLGRPRAAAEIIDEQLVQVPQRAVRTRARYSARGALAYAAAGEIDQACQVAAQSLDGATSIGSATIGADLHSLARTLARYPRNALVRELTPKLDAVLRSSTQ